ncbi:MAG: poly(A) polymerase, partial [Solirubrobacteraceae bacterium]|nr:poly(A) polymerase [Solirubrobacteraceae bacterium]
DALGRLRASERLRNHDAELTRHHLRLGFLVHEAPLSRRSLYRYLTACGPVAADVTLLSTADRLATRGRGADLAITRHLELAREVLSEALRWRAQGPPRPLLAGDELAGELGIKPGPRIGQLLSELAEAQFAGEIRTRDEALALARASA